MTHGYGEHARHVHITSSTAVWYHSIARTTPALLALYAMVTVMAAPLLGSHTMPVRTAAWYRKEPAAFSDPMALVRRCWWRHGHGSTSGTDAAVVKIPRVLLERLNDALCYAAYRAKSS